jgi:hypothetical protein
VAAAHDELLESLDLQHEETPELSLGSGSEIETVSADELSLETPAPVPRAPSGVGRATLVRSASEVDEMRARLGRTTDPELTLDTMDADDEDIEEISFDTAPSLVPESEAEPAPTPAPPPRRPAPAAPAPRAAAPAAAPKTLPPTRPPGPPVPASAAANATLPPVGAAPSRPVKADSTAPIRVSATLTANDKTVAVPVEVTVRNGQGQVELKLHIVLDLKVVP